MAAAFAYYDRFTDKVRLELRPAELSKRFSFLYRLSFNKLFVDEFYSRAIIRPVQALSRAVFNSFDMGVIDRAVDLTAVGAARTSVGVGRFDDRVVDGAVNLTGACAVAGGEVFRSLQSGQLRNYFSVILISLIAVLAVYFAF